MIILMRTYLRILFNNLIKNNFFIKIFYKIVNFYCSLWFNKANNIKFSPNMSINDIQRKKAFFFQSITGDKIDCK